MDLDSAVDEAFDEMLDGFLMMNKAEVKNMFLTEYNEEKSIGTVTPRGKRRREKGRETRNC